MNLPSIDLNCDMGESFGAYTLGEDAAILPYITSANIACGYHAGDPGVMDETVRLAAGAGVRVGAHPGYPDLQGFGRREMSLSPAEAEAMTLYQVGALAGFARAHGVELTHVKPHGALYNQATRDRALAAGVARAVARFSRSVILVGLAGSLLLDAGQEAGLATWAEGFVDRAYNPDGTLRSRKLPGALLETAEAAAEQALRIAEFGISITLEGQTTHRKVDTLCLHGDGPHALEFARAVREILTTDGHG